MSILCVFIYFIFWLTCVWLTTVSVYVQLCLIYFTHSSPKFLALNVLALKMSALISIRLDYTVLKG